MSVSLKLLGERPDGSSPSSYKPTDMITPNISFVRRSISTQRVFSLLSFSCAHRALSASERKVWRTPFWRLRTSLQKEVLEWRSQRSNCIIFPAISSGICHPAQVARIISTAAVQAGPRTDSLSSRPACAGKTSRALQYPRNFRRARWARGKRICSNWVLDALEHESPLRMRKTLRPHVVLLKNAGRRRILCKFYELLRPPGEGARKTCRESWKRIALFNKTKQSGTGHHEHHAADDLFPHGRG